MKKAICIIIALLLLLASVAVLYPDLLFKVYDKDKINSALSGVTEDENIWETLGLANFPFYGNETETGMVNVCLAAVPYINGDTNALPDLGTELKNISSRQGFVETLYYFIIISLLTIPVYMILRLVPFNALYKGSDETFLLLRPFLRGLCACTCSVISVTITWFLYHTLIYKKLYKAAEEWFKTLSMPSLALNLTNIVIIAVAVICVIYLLKTTLFRGSFFKSVLLAVIRCALFVTIFAIVNTFISCDAFRVILFALAAVTVIGIADMILDPIKKEKD